MLGFFWPADESPVGECGWEVTLGDSMCAAPHLCMGPVICQCRVQGCGAVSLLQLPLRPLLVCSLFAVVGSFGGWGVLDADVCSIICAGLLGASGGKEPRCWLGRCVPEHVPAVTRVACVLLLTPRCSL